MKIIIQEAIVPEGVWVVAVILMLFSLFGLLRSRRRLRKQFPPILDAGANGDKEGFLRALSDRKTDINCINMNGTTPLIFAVTKFGTKAITEKVLDRGALIDWQDSYGNTALHYATRGSKITLVRLLVERGATKDIKNQDGQTPLDIAREKKKQDLIDLLSSQ